MKETISYEAEASAKKQVKKIKKIPNIFYDVTLECFLIFKVLLQGAKGPLEGGQKVLHTPELFPELTPELFPELFPQPQVPRSMLGP